MKPSVVKYLKEYIKGSEFMCFNKIRGGVIIIKSFFCKKCWGVVKILLFYPQLVTDPFGSDLNNSQFHLIFIDMIKLFQLNRCLVFKKYRFYVMSESSKRKFAKAVVRASGKRDKWFRSSWEKMKYNVK